MQLFPWTTLLDWYKENGRAELPWRNYEIKDEKILLYRIWISEIFLQQTQVSRVIDYFEKVIQAFPNIETLSKTDYETFFPYYQGLGYYSRARNILKTAKIIQENYSSQFPKEPEKLKKLPWVWPYTANALLAFGYGEPYLAWDTNLEKVFSRYYKGRKDIKLTTEEREEIEAGFHDFIEWIVNYELRTANVRAINNALMDFAALVDLKNPEYIDWENYPIRNGKFYETRWWLEPKEEKKSVSFPIPDATVIVVLHKEHKIYYSPPISVIPGLSRNPDKKERIPSEHRFLHTQEWQEQYVPFILPPPLHRETRGYVQEHFRSNYNLELSVRPIQKKWMSEDGKPYVIVNAQVQTWRVHFLEFSKKEYLSFLENIK
jgi:A/G-specific adenine glycosylase